MVDQERHADREEVADDEQSDPFRWAADRYLSGRYETDDECREGADESHSAHKPHSQLSARHLEGARRVRLFEAQLDKRPEHQHVHDEIHGDCKGGEYLVGRLHRGQQHEDDGKDRYDRRLEIEDVDLYSMLICLLEDERQISGLTYGENTFARSRDPCVDSREDSEGEADRDDRRKPFEAEGLEEIAVGDKQALCKVDVLLRDDETDRQCAKDEDSHCDARRDENGERVILLRVLYLVDVDRRDLHSRVEEEYTHREREVAEVPQVGDEVAGMQRHVDRMPRNVIEDAEDDEDRRRDDGADESAPFAYRARERHPSEVHQRRAPVKDEDYRQGVHLVRREGGVRAGVRSYIRHGNGGEGQDCREPYRVLHPLEENSDKAEPSAECLPDPPEYAALLRPCGRHFRRGERHGDQEEYGREYIVKHRRKAIFSLRRQAAQADYRGDVHHSQCKDADRSAF
ncbi:hypothetical protein SDC9_116940 [bioreactor metagenome]|uniref:Uncharacterized protein n=1 Tax=bioreactor metagenome TaxID=1076179 RepID=A0A645BXF6_9ZZZZ